jgi:hypothetical protein
MGNMPGPEHKPNGEPTRLLLSLNAWGASSKADAKKKAASMSSVEKSYVGAGAYRSISSLSPRARNVLRNNLIEAKDLRREGMPHSLHGPSSVQQRKLDHLSMIENPRGSGFEYKYGHDFYRTHRNLAAIAAHPDNESKTVKNLHFHPNVPQHLRDAAEKHLAGKKLKKKVSVHLSSEMANGYSGFTLPAHKGGSSVVLPHDRHGLNPKILTHELEHAAKGGKGRTAKVGLQTSSSRQREEAFADLKSMGSARRASSSYSQALGTHSVYAQTLREQKRKLGQPFKDSLLDVGLHTRKHLQAMKTITPGEATKTSSYQAIRANLAPYKNKGKAYEGASPDMFKYHVSAGPEHRIIDAKRAEARSSVLTGRPRQTIFKGLPSIAQSRYKDLKASGELVTGEKYHGPVNPDYLLGRMRLKAYGESPGGKYHIGRSGYANGKLKSNPTANRGAVELRDATDQRRMLQSGLIPTGTKKNRYGRVDSRSRSSSYKESGVGKAYFDDSSWN